VTRHRKPDPPPDTRGALSRLMSAPRRPLNETLWFRGWIVVVCLPLALFGQGITEIAAGELFGVVWLVGGVAAVSAFLLYARKPVVGSTSSARGEQTNER